MNYATSIRSPVLLAGLLLVTTSSLAAELLKPREVDAIPHDAPDRTIAYGAHPDQIGQLYLPKGRGPFPVAVVIHGGCWKKFADLKNTEPMSDALRRAGFAAWNIEYRRADSEGGGWPNTFLDVGAAIDHLRMLAREHPLDLQRVVTVGHSAGGHFALWSAARHRLAKDSPLHVGDPVGIRAAVNLGGPGRLQSLSAEHLQKACGSVAVTELLGAPIERVPERVRDGSPSELVPIGVQQVLISGTLDWLIPPKFAEEYQALARSRGDDVQSIVIPDAGHFELIAPTSQAWPIIERTIVSLGRTSHSRDGMH